MFYNFTPIVGGKKLAVTASSASTSIPKAAGNGDITILNEGSSIAYVAFGTTSATAVLPSTSSTDGGYPIPAGGYTILAKGEADTIAAICNAAQSTTLSFCAGQGA